MSLTYVQVQGLVKGDVVVQAQRDSTVKAILPHPALEDHALVLFTDSTPNLERENGELVRIRPRKRPVY